MRKRRLPPAAELLPRAVEPLELAAVPTDYLDRVSPFCDGRELELLVTMLRAPRIADLPPSTRQRAYRCRRRALEAGVVPTVPLKVLRLAYRLGRLRLPPGIDPYTPPTPGPSQQP